MAAREGDPPERVDVSGSWVHADVSSAVSSNGRYDFYVLNEVDLVGTEFRSAESGAGGSAPILVIMYEFTFDDGHEVELKGISDPQRVHAVKWR